MPKKKKQSIVEEEEEKAPASNARKSEILNFIGPSQKRKLAFEEVKQIICDPNRSNFSKDMCKIRNIELDRRKPKRPRRKEEALNKQKREEDLKHLSLSGKICR